MQIKSAMKFYKYFFVYLSLLLLREFFLYPFKISKTVILFINNKIGFIITCIVLIPLNSGFTKNYFVKLLCNKQQFILLLAVINEFQSF